MKQRFITLAEKGKDTLLAHDACFMRVFKVLVEGVTECPGCGGGGNEEVVRAVRAGKDLCFRRREARWYGNGAEEGCVPPVGPNRLSRHGILRRQDDFKPTSCYRR